MTVVPKYVHFGKVLNNVDMRGEVALLTRNIKIRGEMASDYCPESNGNCKEYDYDTFGGHIKVCLAKCMFTIRSFPRS